MSVTYDDEPRSKGAALGTAAAAVAGLVLAVVTALGIASAAESDPKPVEDPVVLYGER